MISLHGRTLRQLYAGQADWEAIGREAKVVHAHHGVILGNGDITGLEDAKEKVAKYGLDGVLIGRSAEGNPGIFSQSQIINSQILKLDPTKEQRLAWMVEHAQVFEKIFKPEIEIEGDVRWFMPMRKHLAWYCKGFDGAVEMRSKLMLTNNVQDVMDIVKDLM
jgi:tRNA-dihydrouridine synthase